MAVTACIRPQSAHTWYPFSPVRCATIRKCSRTVCILDAEVRRNLFPVQPVATAQRDHFGLAWGQFH